MSFNVHLQYNKSATNKVTKDISDIAEMNGVLKDGTSILTPTIQFSASVADLAGVNYMYIGPFGRRSYFVTDIRSLPGGIVEVDGRVDVLYTYRGDIRACTGIISSQQSVYNLYLNDGSLQVRSDGKVLTKSFPSGFGSPHFVLAVAGS